MARLLALALLLTPIPLTAQDAPPAPAPPPQAKSKPAVPTGRITGRVLCADTHSPARGATVMVSPVSNSEGARSVMTHVAMDGTYTVERLAPATYIVITSLSGYISDIDAVMSEANSDHSPAAIQKLIASTGSVTITGSETETYDVSLQRGAALSGRVFYSDGAPATQVAIHVEDVNAKKPTDRKQQELQMVATMSASMLTHQSLNTDDQGHFRIAGLKPGTYRVAAISSTASYGDGQDDDGDAYVSFTFGSLADRSALRVYSGDTLHAKAAKTYELRSGDEVSGVDITIPLNAYHQIKGILTAVDGRIINSATLTLTDTADSTVTFESRPSQDGAFIFPTLAAGTYTLAAKDARIMAPESGPDGNVPTRFAASHATNAFADGSTSIIVKDSDVPDVALTLTEVPLPTKPAPPTGIMVNPDDQPEPQP